MGSTLPEGAKMAPRKTTSSPPAEATTTRPPDASPFAEIVMTTPMVVGLRARAAGDQITTDPDTAARLIASGYAVPTDTDLGGR